MELLHPTRYADRPALVTKVALELTDDGGCGKGGELEPPFGVEALHRLEQTEGRHLDQIVEGDAAVGEPASQVDRQSEVGGHELVSDRGVTTAVVVVESAAEPLPFII